jgi:phosphoribosyl 1,2-cyclic phosphodiesterase
MMTEICAIASGSNGNCYYIGNETDAILIDAGINCKQIFLRMAERGLDPQKLRAVFLTHEHSDHCIGAKVLCGRLKIPSYSTTGTYNALSYARKPRHHFNIKAHESIQIGDLEITAFPKMHDAQQPCSYVVSHSQMHIGVMTDIGSECDHVAKYISQCHVLLLESNYDEEMLQTGPYPYMLKRRIAGERGHLSNKQAVELVEKYASDRLHTLMLTHLSGENNTIEKALEAFEHLKEKYIVLPTSRHEASEILTFE